LTFLRRDEAALGILEHRDWAPYPWPSHAASTGHPVSLDDALISFHLPPLDACSPELASSHDPMHAVPVWSADRYAMVSAIPPRTGQSAWENNSCLQCGRRARDSNRVKCTGCGATLPRPTTRGSDGQLRLITGFHTSYRRMAPNEPASTVTTASGHVGSDRTIHPWENRLLSPRECALLQTFPSDFQWGESLQRWGHTNVRAMIGEAVPPLFTRQHGRVLAHLLQGIPPRMALSAEDPRVKVALRSLERSAEVVAHEALPY
jgi:DNA (cytosine-5)-methyltransferase 1